MAMGVMKIVLVALAGWGAIAIVMVEGGRVKSLEAQKHSRGAVTRAIYVPPWRRMIW
jgi:hypothetical protein